MARKRALSVLTLLAPMAALAMIWEAEVRAYFVWLPSVDPLLVEKARHVPDQRILDAIAAQRLGLKASAPTNQSESRRADAVRQAEQVLSGTIEFHRLPPIQVAVPFKRSNFDAGTSSHQLLVAGMVPVDMLLEGYRASGDLRFLKGAIEEIAAFERVDRYSLIPAAFQWNDHALANTMSILAEAWSYARQRPDLSSDNAQSLMVLALRTARRLAKPSQFTYRTNHGFMQSVALVQFAAAFPVLESASELGAIGCQRIDEQLRYYVSPEGVVLEHSAGYHEFGRQLLGFALQLADLGACRATADWRTKYESSRAFANLLWRPDGSLSVFGNTDGADRRVDGGNHLSDKPRQESTLLPVSGYAVWWSGLANWPSSEKLSQTIVTWSNFPSRAHKHADDLSVLIWSRGVSWLTTVGYWPYDTEGYNAAQSWDSANGPHFTGERPQSIGQPRIIGYASSGRLRALDLERPDDSGRASLRRQIIQIDGATWLIADAVSGTRDGVVERLWTSSSITNWVNSSSTTPLLQAKDSAWAARISVLGDLASPPSRHYGERDPLAGWNVHDTVTVPAPALRVTQKGPASLVVTVIQVDDKEELSQQNEPRLEQGATAEAWNVVVPTLGGDVSVYWGSDRVRVAYSGTGTSEQVVLEPPLQDWETARAQILASYLDESARYTRFRELIPYRYNLTWLVVGLLLVQAALLWVLRRRAPSTWLLAKVLSVLFWPLFGFYCAYGFLGQ